MIVAGGPQRSTNGASNRSRGGNRSRLRAHAVELLERAVPADDRLVGVEHHQAVVERLEDVLVELAHAAELSA